MFLFSWNQKSKSTSAIYRNTDAVTGTRCRTCCSGGYFLFFNEPSFMDAMVSCVVYVLLWQDGSGSSGLFTSLKCEFLASRLPGLHSCIFAWFWIGRSSEHVAVVEETLGVLVYITTNIQKQEQTEAERHPRTPRPRFHKRCVQVHSKSINLLRLH